MFGYLTPDPGELRMRDFALYRATYCGICASLHSRYGRPFCAFLSYDATLIALIASVYNETESTKPIRCRLNPLAKVDACCGPAEDYAADANLLYAYLKCRDDMRDDKKLRARALERLLRGRAARAKEHLHAAADACEQGLIALSALEQQQSDDLDATSMAWGDAMAGLFAGLPGAGRDTVALAALGRDLGRWIYLLDAWDDLDRDAAKGTYNPLIQRFGSVDAARAERAHVKWMLEAMLYSAGASAQLLDTGERAPIWQNIIERGVWRQTEAVLDGNAITFRPVRFHS